MKQRKAFGSVPPVCVAGALLAASVSLFMAAKKLSVPLELCRMHDQAGIEDMETEVHLDSKEDSHAPGFGKLLFIEKRRLSKAAKNMKEEDVDSRGLFHERKTS